MRHLITKLFLVICLVMATIVAQAEDFFVVRVKGQIKVNGKVIKPGDKISTGQKIQYVSSDANAVVISTKRGQLLLKKDAKISKSETELTLASLTNPPKGQLSTRAGAINNTIDLQNHFSKEKYLLLGTAKVEINSKLFELDQNRFFFISYKYKGEEIPKMLGIENGDKTKKIVIVRDDLFKVDGKAIDWKECSDYQLKYYDAEREVSKPIANIDLIAPENDVVKAECRIIKNTLEASKKSEEDIISEIRTYLINTYGTPTSDNFKGWYSTL